MEVHGTRHEILFLAIFTLISVPKLRELITWAMSGLSGCKTKKFQDLISSFKNEGMREKHLRVSSTPEHLLHGWTHGNYQEPNKNERNSAHCHTCCERLSYVRVP